MSIKMLATASLGVLIALFTLLQCQWWHERSSAQLVADAAALAAAQRLAENPGDFDAARREAERFAQINRQCAEDCQIEFLTSHDSNHSLDVLAMVTKRGRVGAASATAELCFDVVGFHPTRRFPAPCLPFASVSDPSLSDPDAWESQVEAQGGESHRASLPSPVFRVRLAVDRPSGAAENAMLYSANPATSRSLADQFENGLTRDDLSESQGEIKIGSSLFPATAERNEITALTHSLGQWRQNQRVKILPLFERSGKPGSPTDLNEPAEATSTSEAIDQLAQQKVARFVAVRLLGWRYSAGVFELELQPARFSTNTAILRPKEVADSGAATIPYIGLVRLVRRSNEAGVAR